MWVSVLCAKCPNGAKRASKNPLKPLSFRGLSMVEATGFEPAASWSRTKRATSCATPRQPFHYRRYRVRCQGKFPSVSSYFRRLLPGRRAYTVPNRRCIPMPQRSQTRRAAYRARVRTAVHRRGGSAPPPRRRRTSPRWGTRRA